MATITLSLSKKVDEFGKAEILIRFSASQTQRFRLKSGFYVPLNRWTKKQTISIPKIETSERKMLQKLDEDLEGLKKHLLISYEKSDKSLVDKDWLLKCIDKFHFPNKYADSQSEFFQVFEEFLRVKKMSAGRYRSIKVVYRILKRFELYKQKEQNDFTLQFSSFNKDTLIVLEDYIKNEFTYLKKHEDIVISVDESRKPDERGQNTINSKLIMLRTFFNWCVENEIISQNPFQKFPLVEAVYGTPYYITIEERNQIYRHDFSNRPALGIQRDIFVFQCLVGCRIGDLYGLKKSNIINGAVEYIARKTKDGNPVTVRVPLNSIALEIIKRYANTETNSLFPFIAEQNYNYAIKEIFLHAGITRKVTVLNPRTRQQEQVPINEVASSHLARRCFIGNLYKQVKDPNLVGSLSGHKEGSKAFARYRDIDDDIKNDLVKLLL